MIEFIDKTSEKSGTPINRDSMMAIQGFQSQTTVFNNDGSILETNVVNGHTKTTSFLDDGSVVEVFVGEKTITKTTTFNEDGSILEVIS